VVRKVVLALGIIGFLPGGGTLASLLVLGLVRVFAPPLYVIGGWLLLLTGLFLLFAESIEGDPRWCTMDEAVGMLLTLLVMGVFIGEQWSLWGLEVAGFLAFRLFDITKPLLVSCAEKAPGMIGVLADDLVAGVMAGTIISLLYLFVRVAV